MQTGSLTSTSVLGFGEKAIGFLRVGVLSWLQPSISGVEPEPPSTAAEEAFGVTTTCRRYSMCQALGPVPAFQKCAVGLERSTSQKS